MCQSAYLDRHGRPTTPADLGNHRVIGYHHISNAKLWEVDKRIPAALTSRITLNNGEAMRDMAIEGLGLAILPGSSPPRQLPRAVWSASCPI